MASRRFKFKPKPVISTLVRKPKDNLEISESVSKEVNEDQKGVSDSNNLPLIAESVEKKCVDTSDIHLDYSAKSELIVKDKPPNDLCHAQLDENKPEERSEESTTKLFHNFNSAVDLIVSEIEPRDNTQINEKDDEHEILKTNKTNSNEIIRDKLAVLEKNCPTESNNSDQSGVLAEPEKNLATETDISEKGDTSNVTENIILKSNVEKPKVISKFGRFKCKPVLPRVVPRLKSEESNQSSSVDSAVQIKTLDNSDVLEKSQQNETVVNNVDVVIESQNVNLAISTDQSECDILKDENLAPKESNKPFIDSSKPPLSPIKSVHKTFAFKPAPRLSDGNRRPSVQAVESEEDSFQKKDFKDDSKICNDTDGKQLIFKKEQIFSKNKRQPRSQLSTFARMGQDALDKLKTKFGDQNPAKNEMTMLDLIFYNPKSNPMPQKPGLISSVKRKFELDSKEEIGFVEETLAEQSVDDVDEPSNHAMPVPQLKVGPDGEVILDPQSLIIETTDARKNRENLENSEIVQETEGSYSSYFKKRSKRNEWSPAETLQFYRALNTLGTDFALMASLFPNRSRRDIKMKFKREERVNLHLIDKAVAQPMEFDFKALEEEMKQEADLIALKVAENERMKMEIKEERVKKKKMRGTDLAKKKRMYGSAAFKDFVEEDIGEFRNSKRPIKKVPNNIKIKELNEDEDTTEDDHNDNERIKQILTETRSGRIPKHSKSIKMEKEIQIRKRNIIEPKLEASSKRRKHGNQTPEKSETNKENKNTILIESNYLNNNGTVPGLFEEPWDLSVNPISDIEANILGGSQEENESVSMISDLGSSFVDEINMDPSTDNFLTTVDRLTEQLEHRALPPYSSIVKHKHSDEKLSMNSSLLNSRLLTDSMKIIDQLTSNVEDGHEEANYLENEAIKNMSIDNLIQEPVDSSQLSNEPVLITLIPSENCSKTINSSVYNVEIQMPFKIRQKQMKLAKSIQPNNQNENIHCNSFMESKSNIDKPECMKLEQISDVDKSVLVNEVIGQEFPNSEEFKRLEQIKPIEYNFERSDGTSSHNDEIYTISTGGSVCRNNEDIVDSSGRTSKIVNNVLNSGNSFVLSSDGVLRADNIAMFIPQFEIITGDCLDGRNETNMHTAELSETNDYLILEPIEETVIETDTIVYSTLTQDGNECILGE